MARPRKYRHIRDDGMRLTAGDKSGNPYWPEYLRNAGHHNVIPKSRSDHWRQQAGWNRKGRPAYIHLPQPNGREDPISVMLVIDCLLRIEPDGEITANNLTRLLWDNYDQVRWDPITVGRILSSLYDTWIDVAPDDSYILDRIKSGPLVYYALQPDVRHRLFLARARDVAGDIARRYADALRGPEDRAGEADQIRLNLYEDIGSVPFIDPEERIVTGIARETT